MATSKELLKAIEQGARIETMFGGEPVEYQPRGRGDREPWRMQEGMHFYRYAAARCVAVFPVDREQQAEDLAQASEEENEAAEQDAVVTTMATVIGQDDMRSVAACLKTPAPLFTPAVKVEITPEVIAALALVRNNLHGMSNTVTDAISILDNAGIFAAIDEATGYDVDPEPERVSKCTCPPANVSFGGHLYHCPGDPAEWGDMAYTTVGR